MSEGRYADYVSISVEVSNEIATIRLPSMAQRAVQIAAGTSSNGYHKELGSALARIRADDAVRVVVITGAENGVFFTSGTAIPWLMPDGPDRGTLKGDDAYEVMMGCIRHTQIIVEMEKPVIAKVNGYAWGPGASIMFGCDLIVAAEDAEIADSHMALDELKPMVKTNVVPPGDGGAVFAPLYFSPAVSNEYLMLGRTFTGAELARMGVINYAVPMDRLDEVVDDLAARLLRRPKEALALTKRIANKRVASFMNSTLDASAGYEALVMMQNAQRAYGK